MPLLLPQPHGTAQTLAQDDHEKRSLRDISRELAALGHLDEAGRPFSAVSISNVLDRPAPFGAALPTRRVEHRVIQVPSLARRAHGRLTRNQPRFKPGHHDSLDALRDGIRG